MEKHRKPPRNPSQVPGSQSTLPPEGAGPLPPSGKPPPHAQRRFAVLGTPVPPKAQFLLTATYLLKLLPLLPSLDSSYSLSNMLGETSQSLIFTFPLPSTVPRRYKCSFKYCSNSVMQVLISSIFIPFQFQIRSLFHLRVSFVPTHH